MSRFEYHDTPQDAHGEGRIAAMGGHKETANPYRHYAPTHKLRTAWHEGWQEMRGIKEARP